MNTFPAEERINEAFGAGKAVRLDGDEPARRVRGDALAAILTGAAPTADRGPRSAMRLDNAVICGVLDLEGSTVDVPITLTACRFEEQPRLADAALRSLRLPRCEAPGIDLSNVVVERNVEFNLGFRSTGVVSLLGARIGGDLRMAGARLRRTAGTRVPTAPGPIDDDVVFVGSRMKVDGAFLARNLHAEGQFRLISARVGGLFSLSGATLRNPGRITLHGERLEVGESVFFQEGFQSEGRVYLANATIKGGFDGAKATFSAADDTKCVDLVRATVGRNVSFAESQIGSSVVSTTPPSAVPSRSEGRGSPGCSRGST